MQDQAPECILQDKNREKEKNRGDEPATNTEPGSNRSEPTRHSAKRLWPPKDARQDDGIRFDVRDYLENKISYGFDSRKKFALELFLTYAQEVRVKTFADSVTATT